MDGLALDCHYTNGQWKTGFTCLLVLPQYALAVALSWAQHPPTIANVGPGHSPHHGATRICYGLLSKLAHLQGDWSGFGPSIYQGYAAFSAYLQLDLSDDVGSFAVMDAQPHILCQLHHQCC